MSKKELKKKELAELEAMLAQFGYNKPDDQDASQGKFYILSFFVSFWEFLDEATELKEVFGLRGKI